MLGLSQFAHLMPHQQDTTPPPMGEARDPGTLTQPPQNPGQATGDDDLSASPEEPDDLSGIGEQPSGHHVSSGLGDILPAGLMGIASLVAKNSGSKEALAQMAKGFGDAKVADIMKGRSDQHEQENALITDAHKAWQEIHGMDIAHMPPSVKQKVMQLNETYNKALQDGKISPKEALEISAYAGMVKRAAADNKGAQAQAVGEEGARAGVATDMAKRTAQEEAIGSTNPQAAAAASLKSDLEAPDRKEAAAKAVLQNRIDVAEIRSRQRVRAALGNNPDKLKQQAFRLYLTQIAQAKRDAATNGTDPSAQIQDIEDAFMNENGRVPGHPAGGRAGDPLGLGAPPPRSQGAAPYVPGSGGAPMRP